MKTNISRATLERIPSYLAYLKEQLERGCTTISATTISKDLGLGEVQVRKDLGSVSGGGRPKIGYVTEELILDLENFLGVGALTEAVVVGSGKLGLALLEYQGFEEFGVHISAGFDKREVEPSSTKKPVLHVSRLKEYCSEHRVEIGIITAPAAASQEVCDLMVESGIRAIWNFAPVVLSVPEDVIVSNEKLAFSLCMLCKQMKNN